MAIKKNTYRELPLKGHKLHHNFLKTYCHSRLAMAKYRPDIDLSSLRKYKTKLMDAGLDSRKTASKKVVHKASEFLGNKIADAVTKSNNDNDKTEKQEPVEVIIVPS